MMKSSVNTPAAQLAGGLLIGAAVVAAFLIGGDPGSAAVSGALVVGFVLFVYVGRRHSEAVEVMSGIGDERTLQPVPRRVRVRGVGHVVRASRLPTDAIRAGGRCR